MELSISNMKFCHKCGDFASGNNSLNNTITSTYKELSLYDIFETMHGYQGDLGWDYSDEITRLKSKFKLEGISDKRPFCYKCLKDEDIHEGYICEDPDKYLDFIENEIKQIEQFGLSDIDPIKSKELSKLKDIRDKLKVIVFPGTPTSTYYSLQFTDTHNEAKYQDYKKVTDAEHKHRIESIK